MNKKEIAHIRKLFKMDNELMKIFDILNVYIMKETNEVYHWERNPFELVDREKQELYMGNFKKLLTGELDHKLFELKFQEEAEDPSKVLLHQAIQTGDPEEWQDLMMLLVNKMLADTTYERDTVITFVRGQYYRPTKARNDAAEETGNDEVFGHPFILCSVNSTEKQRKALLFDYVEREFKYNVIVDPIIKLSTPEQGFFYPSREIFEDIVKEVAGEQLDSATIAHVYEEIHQVIESHQDEEEPAKLDYTDVERVLTASGVDNVTKEAVERAFETIADDKNYELKANSVIPKFTSKSIKIETKVATITISPQDLRYIKQVSFQGKRCIMIEVDEDAVIEGFTLTTETLLEKAE
ncbi:hypothetical protein BGX30_000780 [Mortierella sp. GBA39]|nr:hypothetical protein BGX30_000780 [Mortierella sp. GBA39]